METGLFQGRRDQSRDRGLTAGPIEMDTDRDGFQIPDMKGVFQTATITKTFMYRFSQEKCLSSFFIPAGAEGTEVYWKYAMLRLPCCGAALFNTPVHRNRIGINTREKRSYRLGTCIEAPYAAS